MPSPPNKVHAALETTAKCVREPVATHVDATSLALGIAMNLAEAEGTNASEALTASNNPLAVASDPGWGGGK